MTKNKPDNLPALDSAEMRHLNTKKIVDGVESVGDYFKDIRKSSKLNMYLNIGIFAIFLFTLLGAMVLGISKGGIDGIWDTRMIGRRFNCTGNNSQITDTVRYYADADIFIKLYGGSCRVYQQDGGK